jgi:Transmembrane family 220, helix
MAPSAQEPTTTKSMFVDAERGEQVRNDPEKTVPLSKIERISWVFAHALMAILFVYCSVVQLNDPDWYLWFFGYLCAAVGCFSLMLQAYGTFLITTRHNLRLISRYMAYASVLALCVHFIIEETIEFRIDTEVGREGLGLALVVGWFAISSLGTPQPAQTSHSE